MQQYTPFEKCLRFLRRYNRYIKVAVIAILLCNVRALKNLTFLVLRNLITLSTSHQTI